MGNDIKDPKSNELVHFLRVAFVEFKSGISSQLVYRWQIFMWTISDLVQPFLLAAVWSVATTNSQSGVSQQKMISYYFLVAIVSKITQDWSLNFVSESIESGTFSKYLVRPYNYLAEVLGMSLAIRAIRLVSLVPFLIVGAFLFSNDLLYKLDLIHVIAFCTALIGGFALNFMLGNIFALFSIYIKQTAGLKAIYTNLTSVLSGEYVPFALVSSSFLILFQLQPYRYVLSFPIEILMGLLDRTEIFIGFGILIFWLIVSVIGYHNLFKVAIKRYEAEGL